jgi:hypothetical protein
MRVRLIGDRARERWNARARAEIEGTTLAAIDPLLPGPRRGGPAVAQMF